MDEHNENEPEVKETMIKFVTTLKSGGDYEPDNAIALASQVARHLFMPHEFICMTDMTIDSPLVTSIPLESNLRGWWSVIEDFRNTGAVIATGLDTVLIDNIDRIGELCLSCPTDAFYMARPQERAFKRGAKYSSGIMIWNGDWTWLYKEFIVNPKQYISRFKAEQKYTEWQMLRNKIPVRLIQDHFDGFYSYKRQCCGPNGVPNNAKWIGFHGNPRPHHCETDWVIEAYNDRSVPDHPFEELTKTEDERLQ